MFCTRRQIFRALNRCRPRWQSTVEHDSSNILHDPQPIPVMQQATHTQNESSNTLQDPQSNPVMEQPTHTQNGSSNILHDPESNPDMQQPTNSQNDSSNNLPDSQSNPIIEQPSHLKFTMQIMSAINSGRPSSCFQIAAKMKSLDKSPDISTYNGLMHAVALAKDSNLILSWAVFDDMLLVGVKPTVTTFVHLIDVIMTPFSFSSLSFDWHF